MFNLPEGPRALFAGDALTRALAAEALGGGGPMKIDPQWAAPYLVEAFSDNYPIVRFFAAQGLAAHHPGVARPDYLADGAIRRTASEQWWELYPGARSHIASFAHSLRARRINVDIEVGE